ncbi:MAG: TRAP transporter substrate-binding protein [Brevinema sp.]
MKLFKILLLSLIGIGLISCTKDQNSSKTQILKLSNNHADDYPVNIAYKKFGELVQAKSGGRFKIENYPSAQLGDQRSSVELAQSGILEFANINSAVIEAFDSVYAVLNLPYIFKDYDHFQRVMSSEKIQEIFQKSLPLGFMPLIYLEGGARSFYTKNKEINTPEDLRGLKIRVQDSPTSIEMIKLMGATPVALNFGEVYTALQQGVIDGAENNTPSLITTGHAEVTKYYTLNNHMRLLDILVVSEPFWNSLNEEDQKLFKEAAHDTMEIFPEMWAKHEQESLAEAEQKYQIKIIEPNSELFRQKVLSMHDAMAKKDPRAKELIDYIRSVEN